MDERTKKLLITGFTQLYTVVTKLKEQQESILAIRGVLEKTEPQFHDLYLKALEQVLVSDASKGLDVFRETIAQVVRELDRDST